MALPRKVFAVIGITFPVTAYRRLACVLIQTTLLHCWGTGALGALFWGTWGTRLGHLGHSSGALVWGTWGTRLGHLRTFFEVLEVPTMQLRHLFAITHLLGKAEALQ